MKTLSPFKNGPLWLCALVMFSFISSVKPALGQKNRAIVNDITTLLEIFQRDYDAIDDPEIRFGAIQNDRANTVSILKAYTVGYFPGTTAWVGTPTNRAAISRSLENIKSVKQRIQAWNIARQNNARDNDATLAAFTVLTGELATELDTKDLNLYNRDLAALQELSNNFRDDNNQLLRVMTERFITKFRNVRTGTPDFFAVSSGAGQVQKSLNLLGGGGMTFTNAVDGLALFLAKRLKEELATQIFDRIKTQLSVSDPANDKFLELKIMLPKTTELLKTISPEQYAGIVNSLKESIEKDLEDLMNNLPNLTKSPKFQELVRLHPEVEFAFLGIQLINDLNKVKSPTEIIFVLENSELIQRWERNPVHRNFANGIKLASLLVYSITEDYLDGRKFVSPDEWDRYYKNVYFYDLFVGFLLQQDKKFYAISFNGYTFSELVTRDLEVVKNWYGALAPKIKELIHQASGIEDEITELKKIKDNGGKVPSDSVVHLLKSSITFLDSTLSVANFVIRRFDEHIDIKTKSSLYFSSARKAIDIFSDIKSEKYYTAISDAVDLVKYLETESNNRDIGNLNYLIQKIDSDFQPVLDLKKELDEKKNITAVTIARLRAFRDRLAVACECTTFDAAGSLQPGPVGNPALISGLISILSDATTFQLMRETYLSPVNQKLNEQGLRPMTPFLTDLSGFEKQRDHLKRQIADMSRVAERNADVIKIINFLVALSKAQSAEDFEKAVEAIVLPAGSALVKRESAWNISLNAYAGFFFGKEKVYNNTMDFGSRTENSLAFTAPVGVAVSHSFGKPCDGPNSDCSKGSSWTLFASIIDIGAFTAVRFNDRDATLPEITFQNILAPGVQLIWGIPKSSFSIAGGIQYGPMLRKVSVPDATGATTTKTTTLTSTDPTNGATTNTTTVSTTASAVLDDKSAFRYGLSILVDIPLINFYTKSKAYRK